MRPYACLRLLLAACAIGAGSSARAVDWYTGATPPAPDFFNQWRGGLHLTGVQLGILKLAVAAGYVQDRVQKGGFYTSLDVRTAF